MIDGKPQARSISGVFEMENGLEYVNVLTWRVEVDVIGLCSHAVYHLEGTIRGARDHVWNINTPYFSSGFPHIRAAFERGVHGLYLRTDDHVVPPPMLPELRAELRLERP